MHEVEGELRTYWDIDAATYDDARDHAPRTALEDAAWSAALRRALPPPPARVLDAGAGTGFLSLLLAAQGYEVTALDFAPAMLGRLRAKAEARGLVVATVEGDAGEPPAGRFDAVVERHLLWTTPEPRRVLEAWREAAPGGRLALLESAWGSGGGPTERWRARAGRTVRWLRNEPPHHHAEYSPELRSQLPLGQGTGPARLAAEVSASGWGQPRIERLRDVEWAMRCAAPSAVDRLLGVAARFALTAG